MARQARTGEAWPVTDRFDTARLGPVGQAPARHSEAWFDAAGEVRCGKRGAMGCGPARQDRQGLSRYGPACCGWDG